MLSKGGSIFRCCHRFLRQIDPILSGSYADTVEAFVLAICQQLVNSGSPAAEISMVNNFVPKPYYE